LNAVPYCPDRRLPGDSRTVVGPSAASGRPLVLQGTPVQELSLRCQQGLKAVPKGPPAQTLNRRFTRRHRPIFALRGTTCRAYRSRRAARAGPEHAGAVTGLLGAPSLCREGSGEREATAGHSDVHRRPTRCSEGARCDGVQGRGRQVQSERRRLRSWLRGCRLVERGPATLLRVRRHQDGGKEPLLRRSAGPPQRLFSPSRAAALHHGRW
jgi:hypothetical protein